MDTIQRADMPLTITPADHEQAVIAAAQQADEQGEKKISLLPARNITLDGSLQEWDLADAVAIDAGNGRTAKMAIRYNDAMLYAAFEVQDSSPMMNSGKDYATLFKTGDTCDIMIAADANADANRTKPAPGDTRLLFTVMEDKPVCVLYQARVMAGEKRIRAFTSPTGEESFERVMVLDTAQLAVKRTAEGYVLEAAVPLAEIGFAPKPGVVTRADLGVLFSNAGGGITILRAYYANKDTAIVEDIPSEVRLQPDKWAILEVK